MAYPNEEQSIYDKISAEHQKGRGGSVSPHSYQQTAAVKSTPMSSLHSAVSALREACSDVGSLADQLCGSAPTTVDSNAERDSSGSHFGQIEDCARAVSDLAASINDDLKRIRVRL